MRLPGTSNGRGAPAEPASGFVRRAMALLLPTALNPSAIQALSPVLVAVMARTADPEAAIGGYQVALSIVLLISLPQLRVQQLTLVFLEDRESARRLGRFVGACALLVAALTALVALPPVGGWLLDRVFAVDVSVRAESMRALVALVPFAPLAVLRMHYYGAALRGGVPGIVWTGTLLGLGATAGIAMLLLVSGVAGGVLVAAVAMSLGAGIEVVYVVAATRGTLRSTVPGTRAGQAASYRAMLGFFGPLLFSALLPAFTTPFVNAAIARAAEPTVSLAAFSAAMGVFCLLAVATHGIQSTSLALYALGERPARVVAFSVVVGVVTLVPVALVAFVPPVTELVLGRLLGMDGRLRELAELGLRLLAVLPPFLVIEQCFASALMRTRRARPIVYINLWRLGALLLVVLVALRIEGLTGLALGALAITLTLSFEALVTVAYARGAYRELAAADGRGAGGT